MKRSGALTLRYFIALLIAYVVGTNLFIYLKILGLEEIHFNQQDSLEMFIPLATTMGIEAAVSIGLLEYFVFSKWSHFSFLKFIVSKYLLLILTFISLSVLIHIEYEYVEKDKPFQALVTETVILLKSSFFLSIMLYMLLFSIFFNLLKTVSEYLGRQAIVSALLGRYQQPAEEDITFIFIDLKSSTSIAERLGHVKYSLFIDQCFRKLTESIYQFNASVYQFVGDEAVLVWKTKQAALGIKPIHLYYDFCKRLEESQSHFMSQFGEIPHFRASIHAGMVAITEIHSVKKDIVYHGDVLNTCARIMAKCSEFNIDLLVSSTIAVGLKDNDRYMPRLLYTVALRGKEQSTTIYEITVR